MKMRKKQSFLRGLSLVGALGLAFCSNTGSDGTMPTTPTTPTTTVTDPATQNEVGPDNGLNHDDILNNIGDIFTDGRQVPPAEGEKLHSCGKIRFNVLTNILRTRGINVSATGTGMPQNAGLLLNTKAQSVWGVPNFPGRVPETIRDTTSSLVSLHDVLLAAAEEWVPTAKPAGPLSMDCAGASLFTTGGTCDRDGFACLMGATPAQRQMDVCDSMATAADQVSDTVIRRRLTVAAMVGTVAMCD